jgi:hypothetical protein
VVTTIDSVLVDGKRFQTDAPMVLSTGARNVQID